VTIEQLALVACGVTVNGLTFALGLAVGTSLKRKDSHDSDNDQATEGSKRWHLPLDIGAPHRPQLRGAGSANQKPEADPAKRPAR
jgi:hypothetical protein